VQLAGANDAAGVLCQDVTQYAQQTEDAERWLKQNERIAIYRHELP
jgi:hypothetical protein